MQSTPQNFENETGLLHATVKKAIKNKDYQTAANTILAMLKSMPPPAEEGGVRYVDQLVLERVELGFQLMIKLAGLPAVPQELKDRMYRRSMEMAPDGRWPFDLLESHWTDVLMVLRKDREEEVLRVVDTLLGFLLDSVDDLVLSRLLSKKTVLLRALNRDEEVPQLEQRYPRSQWLWDLLIGEAAERKDYSLALDLANRAAKVFEPVDAELFRHFDDTSWFMERHFNKAEPIRLAKVYAETKDWKALFELLKEKKDLLLLRQYTPELLPDYTARLLPLYKKCLLEFSDSHRNKHAGSNEIMYEIVKMMSEWTGGQKVVNELVAEFHEQFPLRKKLLEVLDGLVKN